MKNIIFWRFHKKSSQIAAIVCLTHFSVIFFMLIHHYCFTFSSKQKPIVVRTVQMTLQEIPTISQTPRPLIENKKSTSHPIEKKQSTASPSLAKKNASPHISQQKKTSSFPAKKNSPPPSNISQQTLKNIEKSFSSLASTPSIKKTDDIHIPQMVKNPSIQAEISTCSHTTTIPAKYSTCLVQLLQNSLQLPEWGEVRVKVLVKSSGYIQSIEILDTRSAKNSDFLKNQLFDIELPNFSNFGISDAILEFIITFRNAENT